MLAEVDYYPCIERFIDKEFNCIKTGTNKGNLILGLVDVLGAYEISGDFHNDIEAVCVEVKTTTHSFGKSIGQALGYSIFVERCYLATAFEEGKTFSPDQLFIAGHLGAGLIRIEVDADGRPIEDQIRTLLTSTRHSPIPSQKAQILNSLGITSCILCGIYGLRDKMNLIKRKTGSVSVFERKGIRRMYLCNDCYLCIISQEEREERKAKSKSTKKAIATRKRQQASDVTLPEGSENWLAGEER